MGVKERATRVFPGRACRPLYHAGRRCRDVVVGQLVRARRVPATGSYDGFLRWVESFLTVADSDDGWDIDGAIRLLRGMMDPYLWQQGQELYSRGAVEDFAIQANGDIQVRVLDPRDARTFHVLITRDSRSRIRAICRCPYQLSGCCRHQVVAFEYLKAVAAGEIEPAASTNVEGDADATSSGPVLYRLFDAAGSVSTQTDGSLLRVVLQALGSSRTAHRVGLHLYTGTGWTALRTSDVDRWIGRGARGAHPRDRVLTDHFLDDGVLRTEIDSDTLSAVFAVVAGSEAIVDRSGTPLNVTRTPWRLVARVVEGAEHALGVELACRSPSGEERPFDEVLVVPAVAPWIQLDSGELAPLETGIGGALLEELQEEDLSSIAPEDLDRFLCEGLGALERLCFGEVECEDNLIGEVEGVEAARVRLEGTPERLEGRLELRYGEEWVEAPSSPEPWTVERDGKVVRYPPAGQSMTRAHRELEEIGLCREAGVWILEGVQSLARILTPRSSSFVAFELPSKLRTLDLVDRPPVLRLSVRPGAGWRSRGEPGDGGDPTQEDEREARGGRYGVDWFEVDFRLLDDGRDLAVDLSTLCQAASKTPDGVLQLGDGTVLGLGQEPVTTLVDLACRGGADPNPVGASLSVGLPMLAELIDGAPGREIEFDEELLGLSSALRSGEGLEVPPLRGRFDDILRPYQKDAVRWLGGLSSWGVSGILADEMGLGKTVMALAHLFGRAADETGSSGPVLVVCPTSLIFNWVEECKKFCPEVDVVGVAGLPPTEREELILEGRQLLVTSFALLRRDREALESREFRAVVLDEGQHIKNATSQTAKAAFAVRAAERWILSGTPLENHPGELWSLFHFLMPGFLGDAKEFQKRFAEPIRRGDDAVRGALRSRVRPFLLRRKKEQVLTELPPRIEQIERVPLGVQQRALYARYLADARATVESDSSEKSRFRVLAALTRLRQICCDPRLVDDSSTPSAKFELVLELLQECVEDEHRVLLFSQFTSMLDLLEAQLDEIGMRHCRLDGGTRDRHGEVRRFATDPGIPVFLISLKAGGHGLNLTQADTVILYDPWWNPAVEDQAAARAHRMGQTVPVHVHKLVVAGTVEEKMMELQARKRELAESVIEGSEEDGLGGLDLETLRALVLDS